MYVEFRKKSFTLKLILPTKKSEATKSRRIRAEFFTQGTWLGLNQEQFKELLEEVYAAGIHDGASNPYC